MTKAEALRKLRDQADAIRALGATSLYLFGSTARDKANAKSDIDLLIVGNPKPDEFESAVRKFERLFQREINYTLISEGELSKRLKHKDPFIADIWHGKKIKLLAA